MKDAEYLNDIGILPAKQNMSWILLSRTGDTFAAQLDAVGPEADDQGAIKNRGPQPIGFRRHITNGLHDEFVVAYRSIRTKIRQGSFENRDQIPTGGGR